MLVYHVAVVVAGDRDAGLSPGRCRCRFITWPLSLQVIEMLVYHLAVVVAGD